MTTTTGSTSINVHEQFISGKDDIAILQDEIATLKENVEIMAETLNSDNVTMLRQEAEIDRLKEDYVQLWAEKLRLKEVLDNAGIVYEDGAQEE